MKVGICSLGCKVNIYESEYVEGLLKKSGYEIVSFDVEADIYIINTCSVTNEADKKSRKMIMKAKRQNSNAIIVVMGCYSQVKSEECDADIVIGNKDKSKIVEYIEEYVERRNNITKICLYTFYMDLNLTILATIITCKNITVEFYFREQFFWFHES